MARCRGPRVRPDVLGVRLVRHVRGVPARYACGGPRDTVGVAVIGTCPAMATSVWCVLHIFEVQRLTRISTGLTVDLQLTVPPRESTPPRPGLPCVRLRRRADTCACAQPRPSTFCLAPSASVEAYVTPGRAHPPPPGTGIPPARDFSRSAFRFGPRGISGAFSLMSYIVVLH